MFKKYLLCIAALCFAFLLFGTLAYAYGRPFSSEAEFMNYEPYWDTYILRVSTPPTLLSRQDIADHINLFKSLIGANENFAWYSYERIIRVGDYPPWWKWAFRQDGTIGWVELSWLFEPDVTLHVFEYGGTFISRACGNYPPELINPPPPKISGYKWNDLDEDGNWDSGEPPLGNWTIILYKGGQEVARTITNGEGYYQFILDARPRDEGGLGVTPGTFILDEVLKPDWKNTCKPGPIEVLPGVPGKNYSDNNFGNFKYGKISGYKWDDSNVNGIWDGSEEIIPGWPIVLYRDGVKIGETTTDANGFYQFSGLHYGNYTIWEGTISNWRQTYPPENGHEPPETDLERGHHHVLVVSETDAKNNNFGNVELGALVKTVKDYWWETPIPDVTVTISEIDIPGILSNIPPLPKTEWTDSNGEVIFDSLLPGVYKVVIDLPNGWYPEPPTREHTVTVKEGETITVPNAIYDNPNREPRTLGFWKSWRKWYSAAEMQALIEKVKTGSGDFETLSLSTIDQSLSTAGKKAGPQQMATTQYLVFWLNLASKRLGFTALVDLSSVSGWDTVVEDNYGPNDGIMTIHELMKELVERFNSGVLTPAQWEVFKNICDAVNNYEVFLEPPTGPID